LELRLGLRMLVGFSQRHAEIIERARARGRFRSLEDFARRTGLSRSVVQRLSEADAFRSLGQDRRRALWEALAQPRQPRDMPLLDSQEIDEPSIALPVREAWDEVIRDYETTGLSLRAHPISFYRRQLHQIGIVPAQQLGTWPNKRPVSVSGLVILRQRPSTAKGITFVTLEDETGIVNLVVHQQIWQRYYQIARRSPAWIAHGTVQSKYSVIHVVVERLEDFAERLHELPSLSRDFR
jgi:error-prone DNA polymerase